MKKIALITGITGQDGFYLANFLINKNYIVHGVKRRSSTVNNYRIDGLYKQYYEEAKKKCFFLHYGDVTDSLNISALISKIKPDEIYNLAAQSHVKVSFETPEYTANADALGVLRILEAIKGFKKKKIRFYQASTSELYGEVRETPQNELTQFYPKSPYAVAKLYAYWITVNYRESYGMYACNGILFNHESPRRGETFVTRKITRGLANIAQGLEECLYLGNINALRDWGHAKDYVRMQWMMLQQDKPDDYCIATGKQYSVRQFIEWSAKELGLELRFKGKGLNQVAIVSSINGEDAPALKIGDIILRIDKRYFRPAEVESLVGDYSKAKEKLGWSPSITVQEMCSEMVKNDLEEAKKNVLLRENGLLSNISKI